MKQYDMTVLYHPRKSHVVADALSRMSMESVTHVFDNKNKLVKDIHIFAQLGVQLEVSPKYEFHGSS